MSCVGTKTPPSDAASAATTTTLVISSAATTTTTTPSDAKSINLPAPPVKNGHTTTWVSFSSVSVQLFVSFFLRQFPIRLETCRLSHAPNRSIQPYFVFSSLVYDRRGNFTTRVGNRARPTISRSRRQRPRRTIWPR